MTIAGPPRCALPNSDQDLKGSSPPGIRTYQAPGGQPGEPPVGSDTTTEATAYLLNQSAPVEGVNCCQYTGKHEDVSDDGAGYELGLHEQNGTTGYPDYFRGEIADITLTQ